jgi:hypothetical protein
MGAQADRMRNPMLLLAAVLGPWLTSSTACAPVDAAPSAAGKAAAARPAADANPAGTYAFTLARTGNLHDFDFIAGAWTLQNRRLQKRWVAEQDRQWDEFPAVDCGAVYLGSTVNVDEIHFPTRGWAGVTFRNFDLEKRQWSIHWVSSRTGKVDSGVFGGFDGDRGEFYGEDVDDGRPVKMRYLWIKHGPDHAHWEQAFSLDGKTWEVNWMNDLTRASWSTTTSASSR